MAKSRQTLLTFPSPPLKFRTAGFPQYGFKLDSSATTFTHPSQQRAYTWPIALHRAPVTLSGMWIGAYSQDVPSPEALGSPTGYVVLPDLRLLWPHVRLSGIPADLWIRRRALAPTLSRGPGEGPQFTLRVYCLRAAFRTPTL